MSAVADKLREADQSYRRILGLMRELSPDGVAAAAGLVLSLHGHLFGEAADLVEKLAAELQQFVNGVETRMIDSPADETLANITRRSRALIAKARGEQ